MTKYERHPAPEKLLLQITTEAINLLALGTSDRPADVSLLETGAALTVKAWGLSQELLDNSYEEVARVCGCSKVAVHLSIEAVRKKFLKFFQKHT